MNLLSEQKWSHKCGEQTCGYQGEGVLNWEIGTDISMLLYINWGFTGDASGKEPTY